MKKLKRLLTIGVAVTLMFCVSLSFVGCKNSPEDFTVEEHIARISERMRARDLTKEYPVGFTYEDFEVYPLYNENEKVEYYLIEFEPYGFMFVSFLEVTVLEEIVYPWLSMYILSGFYNDKYMWSPYVVNETIENPDNYEDREWLLDENGERIYYAKSPYYITNNINEKKYLFTLRYRLGICAIKKDGDFINLISGQKVNNIREENLYNTQAVLDIGRIAKPQFHLK